MILPVHLGDGELSCFKILEGGKPMIEFGIVVAVLVALGEVFKNVGIPVKYIPLINLILGVVAGIFLFGYPTLPEQIVYGLMVGLAASGLYDQAKILKK
jgi:hypothetical protein